MCMEAQAHHFNRPSLSGRALRAKRRVAALQLRKNPDLGETRVGIESGLIRGLRGLRGGTVLAKLPKDRRGRRNPKGHYYYSAGSPRWTGVRLQAGVTIRLAETGVYGETPLARVGLRAPCPLKKRNSCVFNSLRASVGPCGAVVLLEAILISLSKPLQSFGSRPGPVPASRAECGLEIREIQQVHVAVGVEIEYGAIDGHVRPHDHVLKS